MSDLIDRKIAVQNVKELFSLGDCYCDELSIVGMLNSLVSVKSEREKGKWIKDETGYNFWTCSACGFVSEAFCADILYNYCPNCGVNMRGE